jgi:hypothetical protein
MELLVFKYTALTMALKNKRNWLAIYRLLKLSIRKKSAISGALTSNDHSGRPGPAQTINKTVVKKSKSNRDSSCAMKTNEKFINWLLSI